MIKNSSFAYMALVTLTLAVVQRQFEGASELDTVSEYLPSHRWWALLSLVSAVLSLIPFDKWFGKNRLSRNSQQLDRNFRKQSLDQVAMRLVKLAELQKPDIPYIVDYTIFQAIAAGSSDIHFDPMRSGFEIKFRIDGMMVDIGSVPESLKGHIINRLKVLSNLVVYQGFLPQDGRVGSNQGDSDVAGADFRVAFMPTLHGERIVLRILGRESAKQTFDDLGMTPEQIQLMEHHVKEPQGMIILTGPTGSGKTTTIYAALQSIIKGGNSVRSIATLEDPIEYELPGINQSQVNEKKGFTFNSGLRALLRQDPDVILVGEIRDSETANIAIQAGMTGHLIITTVHANSAASSISRLIEMGIAPYAINSALTLIIAQRLVRHLCISCRSPVDLTRIEKEQFGLPIDIPFTAYNSNGCAGCEGSGYSGRYAIYEFLKVTEEIRDLIGANTGSDEINRAAIREGMKSLYQSGLEAMRSGLTSPEEVRRVVMKDRVQI